MGLPESTRVITSKPHWKLRLHPIEYSATRFAGLADLHEYIQRQQVRVHGWEFPEIDHYRNGIVPGHDWIASLTDDQYAHTRTYWRLYQSGQWISLYSPPEIAGTHWQSQLRRTAPQRLILGAPANFDEVSYFLDISSIIRVLAIQLLFVERIVATSQYRCPCKITIRLENSKNTALMAGENRSWHHYYRCVLDHIQYAFVLDPSQLSSSVSDRSVTVMTYFMERFGWFDPSPVVLKDDLKEFFSGLRN